jgi:hypothetical protein
MRRLSPFRLTTCAVLCAVGVVPALGAQPSISETRLKAAFVSKFPQFVTWPPAVLNARQNLDICVATPNPFGGDLAELVAGESLGGHPLSVRHVDREREVDGCLVLYIPAERGPARRALIQRAASLPILTVSDDVRFLDEGGMVRLRVVSGRVRFDVNVEAATRAGLRLSSQLLQLALTVNGQ